MSSPNWATGYKQGKIRPNLPTEFERKVLQLQLHSEAEMLHSPSLYDWVSRNRDRRYVPEFLLVAYGLQLWDHELYFSNFGANA